MSHQRFFFVLYAHLFLVLCNIQNVAEVVVKLLFKRTNMRLFGARQHQKKYDGFCFDDYDVDAGWHCCCWCCNKAHLHRRKKEKRKGTHIFLSKFFSTEVVLLAVAEQTENVADKNIVICANFS